MAPFDNSLLLNGPAAKSIFAEIESLPFRDIHTHVDLKMVLADEPAADPWTALCGGDHYVSAIIESLGAMTRQPLFDTATDPLDKWKAYARVFPDLLGNQIRDWMRMTLAGLGVERPFNPENAQAIWDELHTTLQSERWRPTAIFKNSNIEQMTTTDCPIDNLEEHLRAEEIFGAGYWRPAWRPDAYLDVRTNPFRKRTWLDAVADLEKVAGRSILGDFAAFRRALAERHQFFASRGCRVSDYGITVPYGHDTGERKAGVVFEKACQGKEIDEAGAADFQSFLMRFSMELDRDNGWISQLHFGAARNQRDLARGLGGLDSGCDTVMGCAGLVESLHDLLNHFDTANDRHHKIFLYTLAKADWEKIAGLSRIFPSVYAGMSWWYFDSVSGMLEFFRVMPDMGAGFRKIGPFVTDARNIYSLLPRTQVYRRCLATVLGEIVESRGEPLDGAVALARCLCTDHVAELLG